MSNNTQAFKCPNCDAPLTVHPGDTVVTCAYCGSQVQVSQPPATPAAPPPSHTLNAPSSIAEASGPYAQPSAYTSYTSIPIPRQAGTVQRATRWAGCLGTLLLIGLCALVVIGGSNLIFRSSPSFDLALKMAQSNPKVAAAFGTPIQPGLFIAGSISTTGNRSHANYDVPISGPRRSGTLHVQGDSTADGWTLNVWAHYLDNGEDITIHMSSER